MINTDKASDHEKSFIRLNYTSEKKVIDIHMHIVETGDSGKGRELSKEFIFNPDFAATLITPKAAPFDMRDGKMRQILRNAIDASENINYKVLMAIDGVYKNGRYIESDSHLVIPNDYIIDIAKTHKHVIFVASVHPYREVKEMLTETRRCIDEGAVFFNWIPSVQQIDPEDDRCIPFYMCIAREGIPLLVQEGLGFPVHTYSFKTNGYNDPKKLRKALDIGVKIIASHCVDPCCGICLPADGDYFDELMEMLRISEEEGWDFYANISALCTPAGMIYLERIKMEIEQGNISPDRFLYVSDR